MNEKDLELYHEEQRQKLIDLSNAIDAVKSVLSTTLSVNVENPVDKVAVTGELTVNTEKAVEITNIDEFTRAVDALSTVVVDAIQKSRVEPPDTITIKNIGDAKAETIKVSNLGELTNAFQSLARSIDENQPVVNVETNEIEWPTSPKNPIPVRLSDGKGWIEQIVAAVGGGAPTNFIDADGKPTKVQLDANGKVPVSSTGSTAVADPLDGYTLGRQALDADPMYVGYENETDNIIVKIDFTAGTTLYYKTAGALSSTWSGRAGYTYVEPNALY
jgi:hypothetical protein